MRNILLVGVILVLSLLAPPDARAQQGPGELNRDVANSKRVQVLSSSLEKSDGIILRVGENGSKEYFGTNGKLSDTELTALISANSDKFQAIPADRQPSNPDDLNKIKTKKSWYFWGRQNYNYQYYNPYYNPGYNQYYNNYYAYNYYPTVGWGGNFYQPCYQPYVYGGYSYYYYNYNYYGYRW